MELPFIMTCILYHDVLLLTIQHNCIILILKPGNRVRLRNLLMHPDRRATMFPLGHSPSRSLQHDIKVHYTLTRFANEHTSVDTNRRVVLDIQVNMFLNTETKVPRVGEVTLLQLVLLNFQSPLKDLLSLSVSLTLRSQDETLGPRTVTCTAIFSFLRIPKVRTVYRA
jgi:hypothetical protein